MNLSSNRGAVLLVAVFIILISSILVVGFLEAATSETEISRNLKSDAVAMYIADAGIEAVIYNLLNGGDGNIAKTEFPDTANNNTFYTVAQTAVSVNMYTVESTGEFGDFERVIEAKIKIAGSAATLQYWKEK